jgi:hypothetical protein
MSVERTVALSLPPTDSGFGTDIVKRSAKRAYPCSGGGAKIFCKLSMYRLRSASKYLGDVNGSVPVYVTVKSVTAEAPRRLGLVKETASVEMLVIGK